MADEVTRYDPDAEFDLRVSRPVKVGSFKYLPRDAIVASGALINRLIEEHGPDAVRSVEPR